MDSDIFAKPLFDGTRFGNPKSFVNWTGVPRFGDVLRWKFLEKDNSALPSEKELNRTLPVRKPDFSGSANLSFTWLGHATTLVRIDGLTLITDPIWSHRASPVSFNGPQRYRPPPCSIDQLPKIDIGVISHNHYDHLDAVAVRALSERFPEMKWFVPLGLRNWMMEDGIEAGNVQEMNWGDTHKLEISGMKYEIWCVPAQHWSQRGLSDRFKTLWSGWVIIGPTRRFYFAGDTGFCKEEFEKIGRFLGPFDIAAIPIGCYTPRWFMKAQHINPAEAVQIHRKIRSKKSFGIHWGTYKMGATEGYLDPVKHLRDEMRKEGLMDDEFVAIAHGETWVEDDILRLSSSSEES